jgi:hypothetical protein
MKWKLITAFLIVTALFFTWALFIFPASLQGIEESRLLTTLNVASIGLNDLSETKWHYWELYVNPYLEDDITTGIDKIIKNKIDKTITLGIRGEKHPPMEMYIITHIDPDTYQCELEDGYADDSFHLPEFSEARDEISYNELDTLSVNLNNDFRFVVEPHIYPEHDWKVLKVKNWNDNKFNLPFKLSHAVLFSIIEEKNITKRKYKVFWILNHDNQT